MPRNGYEVVCNRDGLTVKQERDALVGSGTRVESEEFDWGEFPQNIHMEITGIEPIFNGSDGDRLSELRISASELEVTEESEETVDFRKLAEEEADILLKNDGVILKGDKTAKMHLVDFVELLVNEGYISRSDLPYQMGYKRYLINTEPHDKEGDKMTEPIEVNNDVYVEAKLSKKKIREQIEDLFEDFVDD